MEKRAESVEIPIESETITTSGIKLEELNKDESERPHWVNIPKICIDGESIALRDMLQKAFPNAEYVINTINDINELKHINFYMAVNIDFANIEQIMKFGAYCGLAKSNKSYFVMKSVLFTYNSYDFDISCADEVHLITGSKESLYYDCKEALERFFSYWDDIYSTERK